VGLRHIVASPYHPQTNGKIERYHRTVKEQVRLVVYETPGALERALESFVDYHNHQRLPRTLGNVRPVDVYHGLKEEILGRREEVKERTSILRRYYHRVQREREGSRSVH